MLADATLKSLHKQAELFERAASWNRLSRERIVAMGVAEELYCHLYPHHYRALQLVRMTSKLGKPSSARHDPFQRCESRLVSLLVDIIVSAVQSGELALREDQKPEETAFTMWILAFGTRALMDSKIVTSQLGIEDGLALGRDATTMLLDALGWAPLSTEFDYRMTREKVLDELFYEECRQIGANDVFNTAYPDASRLSRRQ